MWGLLIFNLDRYIVSSMKKKDNFIADWSIALPRIVLAVIISMVISKPLELKIFETEIQSEIVSMQQERRKEHEDLLNARFKSELARLDGEINQYKTELAALKQVKTNGLPKHWQKQMAPVVPRSETWAPSTKPNKLRFLAENEYNTKQAEYTPLLQQKETEKKNLLTQRDEALSKMQQVALTGFASRMEALSRVAAKSNAVYIGNLYYVAVYSHRNSPMFVKVISERSPYDFVLDKIENEFALDHKHVTTMRKMEVNHLLTLENETRSHRNETLIKAENEIFTHAIQGEMDEIKSLPILSKIT